MNWFRRKDKKLRKRKKVFLMDCGINVNRVVKLFIF